MNKDKKIEMIRKRNEHLTQELDRLKEKLSSEQEAYNITTSSLKKQYENEKEQIATLLSELENVHSEWESIISDLDKKAKEYDELIQCVNEVKNIIFDTGLKMKLPFKSKVKIFFKKLKSK